MTSLDHERYPMGTPAKNRGFALIFVTDEFRDREPRKGADKDLQKLKKTFEKLGFIPLEFINKSAADITRALRTFADGEGRKKEHAAAVAFSTHGSQYHYKESDAKYPSDVVYCTDDTLRVKFITDYLAKSEGLRGKPKLFFFQACRGEEYDDTIKIQGEECKSITMDMSGLKMGIDKENQESPTVEVPLKKDMFIMFSGPPGYKALRHVKKGSFFITALHDIIVKHGNDFDLMTLMTFVNNRALDPEFIVKEGQGEFLWETDRMCVPWMASKLLKEVWFS